MTSCPHCGETSFYPSGPHTMGPCPLKKAEHEHRLAVLRAQEEYWHKKRLVADRRS